MPDVLKPRMGDQLTQLSFKDALRQTQKAVLQPIDEDTSRLKASCACHCECPRCWDKHKLHAACSTICHAMLLEAIAARGLIFSMLAFPIMRDIADEARVARLASPMRLRSCAVLKGSEQTHCLFALADHGHLRLPLRAPR